MKRPEAQDYRDIAVMVDAGVSLSSGPASARLLFGSRFQQSESWKARTCFNDDDLHTPTAAEKHARAEPVKAVRDLPDMTLASKRLAVEP